MSKSKKFLALGLLSGGLMFQMGCLSTWFNAALVGLPGTVLAEWLTDNDAVFDLFPDGGGTTTE